MINAVDFPKVTVITVVRNLILSGREKFFRQCLESVRNQTYPNIEHIVIDGASTDGTLELLEEYKKWITYYSEPDEGVYYGMNKGIQKSTGKYINFLNSDDYFCDITGLEKSVELLEDTCAAFSHSEVYACSVDGEKLHVLQNRIEEFFFRMPFCHQGVLMRRDIIVFEGMFNTDLKIICDYDLILRLILKGYRTVSVKVIFVVFRMGGLSCDERQLNIEYTKVWKKYFPKMDAVRKYDKRCTFFAHFITKDQLNSIMSCVDEEISEKITTIEMRKYRGRLRIYGKYKGDRLQIIGEIYNRFLEKSYRLFGVIPCTLQWRKIKDFEFTRIWTIFGVRIFMIKKTPDYRRYYFLYIPVLVIAQKSRKF
jgi:glycosyltransferase involved in cell wall biosynthesis